MYTWFSYMQENKPLYIFIFNWALLACAEIDAVVMWTVWELYMSWITIWDKGNVAKLLGGAVGK